MIPKSWLIAGSLAEAVVCGSVGGGDGEGHRVVVPRDHVGAGGRAGALEGSSTIPGRGAVERHEHASPVVGAKSCVEGAGRGRAAGDHATPEVEGVAGNGEAAVGGEEAREGPAGHGGSPGEDRVEDRATLGLSADDIGEDGGSQGVVSDDAEAEPEGAEHCTQDETSKCALAH